MGRGGVGLVFVCPLFLFSSFFFFFFILLCFFITWVYAVGVWVGIKRLGRAHARMGGLGKGVVGWVCFLLYILCV